MGLANAFNLAYHTQINGQAERFKRSTEAVLRCYVSDHPQNWDEFAQQVAHDYKLNVPRATGTRPFDIVFHRLPLEFILHGDFEIPEEGAQKKT